MREEPRMTVLSPGPCALQPQHADYAACLERIAQLDTVAIELLTGRNFTVPGSEDLLMCLPTHCLYLSAKYPVFNQSQK